MWKLNFSKSFIILIVVLINYMNFKVVLSLSEVRIPAEFKSVGTLTPCKDNSDCEGAGLQIANCINDYCECNGTKFCYVALEVKVTKLGEPCQETTHCHIEHSVCSDGKCQCDVGRVPSFNQRHCVPGPLEDCAMSGNCTQSLNCTENHIPNAAATACLAIAESISSPCLEDKQCSTKLGNAVCLNGTTCQCQTSYRYNPALKKCARLEANCQENGDCQQDGEGTAREERSFITNSSTLWSLGIAPEPEVCKTPSCNGFSTATRCVTGKCECPEERQFCVNFARSTHPTSRDPRRRDKDEPYKGGYFFDGNYYTISGQREPEPRYFERKVDTTREKLTFVKCLASLCIAGIVHFIAFFIIPLMMYCVAPRIRILYSLKLLAYYIYLIPNILWGAFEYCTVPNDIHNVLLSLVGVFFVHRLAPEVAAAAEPPIHPEFDRQYHQIRESPLAQFRHVPDPQRPQNLNEPALPRRRTRRRRR